MLIEILFLFPKLCPRGKSERNRILPLFHQTQLMLWKLAMPTFLVAYKEEAHIRALPPQENVKCQFLVTKFPDVALRILISKKSRYSPRLFCGICSYFCAFPQQICACAPGAFRNWLTILATLPATIATSERSSICIGIRLL